MTELARLNSLSAAAMQPSPIRAWLTRNIWSRSFYVAPISLSVFITIVLWMMRPREFDLRTFIIAWFLSTPVGFLLWVYAWKTNGAGNGHITASVGTTAVLGWCAWHWGLYVVWVKRRFRMGLTICILSGIATASVKIFLGNSTAPITLAMTAAAIGMALPFGVLLAVQASAWQRLFIGRYVVPAWGLLNRPIPFGHVKKLRVLFRSGAVQTGKAQTVHEV